MASMVDAGDQVIEHVDICLPLAFMLVCGVETVPGTSGFLGFFGKSY